MECEDLIISTSQVQEVTVGGRRKVKFHVQAPGRFTEGQDSEYDTRDLRDLLSGWDTTFPDLNRVLAVGQILGNALFPVGPIRDALLASLAAHRNRPDSRLRIILDLTGVLRLLPWEFAVFHTEEGEATQNQILGLMSQVSIVRRLDLTMPRLDEKPAARPAPMVVALASPEDVDPALNLKGERTAIAEALQDSPSVTVTYVEPATRDNLLGGLDQVHLFHFAGHGIFVEQPGADPSYGIGALLLDDGQGSTDTLAAPQVAERLVKAGVRVAVLGACLTARHDEVKLWSSIAANLINGGLGAVVAMQYPVVDDSAVKFAKEFYRALAMGFPIDQAVTKGRLAIFENEDYRGLGTPVLYMGGGNGIVFPEFTNDPALKAERDTAHVVVNLSAEIVEGKVTGIEVVTMRAGQAEATVTLATLKEGAEAIGFQAGSLTGGDVKVDVKATSVGKGARLIGAKIDHLGPVGPRPGPGPGPNPGPSTEN